MLTLYIVRALDEEISTSGLCCVISYFCVECGSMLWLEARYCLVVSIEFDISWCAGIVKRRNTLPNNNVILYRVNTLAY